MNTQTLDLPKKLAAALSSTQQTLDLLKDQRSDDMETEISEIQQRLDRVPKYFQEEKNLLDEIIKCAESNFANAQGEEEQNITGTVLTRLSVVLLNTEKYWVDELNKIKLAMDIIIV